MNSNESPEGRNPSGLSYAILVKAASLLIMRYNR